MTLDAASYAGLSMRMQLTDREREVLGGMARGLTSDQIGAELGITEQTVKYHLTSLFKKLRVANRIQAIAAAVRIGLIPCPICSGDDHTVVTVNGVAYVRREVEV